VIRLLSRSRELLLENCFRSAAQTTTRRRRRRRGNRAFVSRACTAWLDRKSSRALRPHIRIFKTTSESGLTTAKNSDARCREIASHHRRRRRRPCLLNKVTRGSGAASGDTKAHRLSNKTPFASSSSAWTGRARAGEGVGAIKLRNNCLLSFCCYLIFSRIGQRGPIETSSSDTSDPGPK
jgi:hypothetical protein